MAGRNEARPEAIPPLPFGGRGPNRFAQEKVRARNTHGTIRRI